MRKNDLRTGVIYLEALHCLYRDSVGSVVAVEFPMPLVCVSLAARSRSLKPSEAVLKMSAKGFERLGWDIPIAKRQKKHGQMGLCTAHVFRRPLLAIRENVICTRYSPPL